MARIGILVETSGNTVKETNFGMITAIRSGGGDELYALLLSGDAAKSKNILQNYGVSKIVKITADGAEMDVCPDMQAKALIAAMESFNLKSLIGLSSAKGRDLLARVAAMMELPLALDCVGLNVANQLVMKSHFSGKTMATLKLKGDCFICGIRPNAFEPEALPCVAEVETYNTPVKDCGRITIKKLIADNSRTMELAEANIIITGGRPIGSSENFKLLEECAQALGAAVGASRAAVDAGYAPHSMQVGQTGKTVSPKLYIGCGLSGSVQHFAGMKTSKVIVGINVDKNAPIFTKCDYGVVGDLFEVVPALTHVLKENSKASDFAS